jgi:hypothetical protein
MTKLTVDFRNFTNAPTTYIKLCLTILKYFCYAVTFIGYGCKQLLLGPCAPSLTERYTEENRSEMGTN